MTTRSGLIIPDHLNERQLDKMGRMNATRDEVADLCASIIGPYAVLLREVAVRQQAMEDVLGLIWVEDGENSRFVRTRDITSELRVVYQLPSAEATEQAETPPNASLDLDELRVEMGDGGEGPE